MTAPVAREPLPKFIHPDDMPDRYALTGKGTCMSPHIPDGACCVFDKRPEPQSGDIVAIIFTEEAGKRRGMAGWIKRLLIAPPPPCFDGWMVVEQHNPPRAYSIPTGDVAAIHKFIGIAEGASETSATVRLTRPSSAA